MKNQIWEILLAIKLILIEIFGGFFLTISTVHTVCVLHKPCDDVDSFQQGDHFISFEAKN